MTAHMIVGGGLAAGKTAEALRAAGHDGEIVLISDEPHLPYERPPLSKSYLMGTSERERVFVHPQSWYAEHGIDLRLGQPVTALDSAARTLTLAAGATVRYDTCLLATGSVPRRLDVPGADAAGVHYLRKLDESDNIKSVLGAGGALAVIGAGWIGLEVAAAARSAGLAVTVVEAAELPLLRVLGPEVARIFAQLHRDHDVDLRLGSGVDSLRVEDAHVRGVRLNDGSEVAADAVVVGVGIGPEVSLARKAGLRIYDGVLADEHLRTSDPHVFAAGDVVNAFHPFYGRPVRVEHWANALNQPTVVAANMLGGDQSYDALPYFYTDQYDLGMEYVGYVEPGGYDEIVFRGRPDSGEFIAFWCREQQVLAGMNVNVWDVVDPIKAIIRSRAAIDPVRLADPSVELADLI